MIRKRKERSDKKRDCKPIVPNETYKILDGVSYITSTPLMIVGEYFIIESLSQTSILDKFEHRFVRNFVFSENLLYRGTNYLNQSKVIRLTGLEKRKVHLRLERECYERLSSFAYALDYTPTSAASLLLQIATKNATIVQGYVEAYVERNLDIQRKWQLQEVISYINKNSDEDVHYPLASLIGLIVEKFMRNTNDLKKAVDKYLATLDKKE